MPGIQRDSKLEIYSLTGVCLLAVQQAERIFSKSIEMVLKEPNFRLADQTETEQNKTLSDFLKKLKKHVSLEYSFKEKLYHFRDMRNTFVHNLDEIDGWDLSTENGRETARKFLIELTIASMSISGLFTTLVHVSAKDDFRENLLEGEPKWKQDFISLLEAHFGPRARKILSGRYRKPVLVRSQSGPRTRN